MALSSLQLEAFVAVARYKSFSQAATYLHVTQSALSQRILNLEQSLEVSLFLRESSGLRLSETGETLLKYCHIKDSLEEEFVLGLQSKNKAELSGIAKFGSFSSHARSVLLPALGSFCQKHPRVKPELLVRELHELPGLLRSGQADFVYSLNKIESHGIENILVGYEENILVEAKGLKNIANVYLDHDAQDTMTQEYLRIQKSQPSTYSRYYFDEVYALIDAVELGLGRAVIPRHLIEENKNIKPVPHQKPLKVPVYFIYYHQSYYSELQKEIIRVFQKLSL